MHASRSRGRSHSAPAMGSSQDNSQGWRVQCSPSFADQYSSDPALTCTPQDFMSNIYQLNDDSGYRSDQARSPTGADSPSELEREREGLLLSLLQQRIFPQLWGRPPVLNHQSLWTTQSVVNMFW